MLPLARPAAFLRLILVTATLVLLGACAHLRPADPPPLILVGVDGLSPLLLERGVTPHLSGLAVAGVKAEGMRPSFPSKTFPNFYTLVTGLRPDHHGIVDNNMEDAAIPGVRFSLSNKVAEADRRWWDQGEPVWVTAERAGVRSATMFWPGSATDIRGVRPSEWRAYDSKVTPAQRVDTVLAWLDKPAVDRPRFLTLYFDDVDTAGHDFGPDAPETHAAAARVDEAVGRLLAGLKARAIDANIVVVADHGMAALSKDRLIRLDRVLPEGSYRVTASGSHAGIEPLPGKEAVLAAALQQPQPHMSCWPRESIPARFEYGRNPRVPRFFCLAEVGWYIVTDARGESRFKSRGTHGYDHEAPEMRAAFVAAGPSIRTGATLGVINNVDVYSLLMRLLGLPPLQNDGDPAALRDIVRAR